MKRTLRSLCLFLVLALCLGLFAPALALPGKATLKNAANGAARWILSAVSAPGADGYGADWAVISLARSGCSVEENWYRSYLSYILRELEANGGALNTRRYTDYAKAVIAFTALGQTPPDELIRPLSNFEKVCLTGINGPSWALIALDSGGWNMKQDPAAKTQATRQLYVDEILSRQLADGGWTLSGKGGGPGPSDPDVTAMMLQALANYMDQEAVAAAVDRALTCMSRQQQEDGGLASYGVTCSESPAQMILALCALGLSPEDERFVKSGGSLVDAVLRYRQTDGSFIHAFDAGGTDLVATEQALAALTAVQRYEGGKPSYYAITDPLELGDGGGLPGKDPAVSATPITVWHVRLSDLGTLACRNAVVGLAQRRILNGYEDGTFKPENSMTRAEFAKTAVTALGIRAGGTAEFPDVPASAWYSAAVAAAARYGIVGGRDDGRFDPNGNINLQEAAAMVCRAAGLCGLDTALSTAEASGILSGYTDMPMVQAWARPTLAWCLKNAVVTRGDTLSPKAAMTRGEIAMIFWKLLELANLQ
jgi:hypothetical protein